MGRANLFAELYELAAVTPNWTRTLLTVNDTNAVDADEIEQVRQEISQSAFEQEYLCSFDAAIRGAYFGTEMAQAEKDGRIGKIPYDPALPVDTSWDIGIADLTVVAFWQTLRTGEARMINCKAFQNTGLPEIKKELDGLPYTYGAHYAPHDIKVREWGGSGQSRLETARQLGINYRVVRNIPLRDGIEATRVLLPRVWFDREHCFDCIEALKLYRADYQDEREVFSLTPLRDWTTHYADAVRMYAVGYREQQQASAYKPRRAVI
jgi:hypothetical protein